MASSSLRCEITVIQAKNIQIKESHHGSFFVRYHLSAPNNKKIQINTKEVSSKSDLLWNESTSVECLGTQDTVNNLKKDNIVMELRWRSNSTNPIRSRSSKLVGTAEIPWSSVFESANMEVNEKWVTMISSQKMNRKSSVFDESIEHASVQICMRLTLPNISAQSMVEKKKRINRSRLQYDCEHNKCQDYEIFALVGAFEVAAL